MTENTASVADAVVRQRTSSRPPLSRRVRTSTTRGTGGAGSRRNRRRVVLLVTVGEPGALERTRTAVVPRAAASARPNGRISTLTLPARVSACPTTYGERPGIVTLRSQAALQRTGSTSGSAGLSALRRGVPTVIRGVAGGGASAAPSTA